MTIVFIHTIVLLGSFNLYSQSAHTLITGLPFITIPSTWSGSNSNIKGLNKSGLIQVPETLISQWKATDISLKNEFGVQYSKKARFFKGDVRAVGKVNISSGYYTVLFCRFSDNESQRVCALATFNSFYQLISVKKCFRNPLEMQGFYKTGSTDVMILTSGEEFVTENLIRFGSNGIIQNVSSIEVTGKYNFN